jgi:PST family polysaccharide transporter
MLDRRVFSGALMLAAANVAKIAVQVLMLPILARILGPEAYGVIGVALPFVMFANMLCDGGMSAALARDLSPSHTVESTIFWLSTALGVALSLIICAAAAPLAQLFHEPSLAPILAVMTIVLVLSSSLSVPNARITRTRRFSVFAIGEVAATLIGVAVALTAAARGFGAWSLVLQQLAFWIIKVAYLVPASGFRPTFECSPAVARPYLRFGLHMVGANFGDFLNRNIPILTIGGLLGTVSAGHYSLAAQLTRIPEMVVSGSLFLPLFTAASRAQAAAAPLNIMARRTLSLAFTVLAPVFCGLVLTADLLTHVLLGPKWIGTEALLQVVAPGSFLICMFMLVAAILQGVGRADVQFRLSMACAVLVLVGVVAGAQFGSAATAAGGISVALAVAAAFYLRALSRELQAPLLELVADLAPPAGATLVMAGAVLGLRQVAEAWPAWLQLGGAVAAGVVSYAAALLLFRGRRAVEDLTMLLPARKFGLRPVREAGLQAPQPD